MSAPVPLVAEPRVKTTDAPQRHGGFSQGGRSSVLHLVCRVAVIGSSSADLRTKLDNLVYLLRPEQGDKAIKFDFIADRYWLGRLATPVAAPPIGDRSMVVDLDFVCADPLAYSTTLVTQETNVTASPQTVYVPDGSGETVDGTAPALPTLLFEHTGATGDSTTAIRVASVTSGQTIEVTKPLALGDQLRINCETELIEYSDDGGSTWTNVNSFRSNTYRRFPRLSPRVQNEWTVTVTGDNSTLDLTTTYRARYRS